MLKIWSKEEVACLRDAVHCDVQLKVIAHQLGRTVSGVSKTMTRHGLRRASLLSRKKMDAKGERALTEKWDRDIQKMKNLVVQHLGSTFVPLSSSSKKETLLEVLEKQDLDYGPFLPRGFFDCVISSWELAEAWGRHVGLSFEEVSLSPALSDPVYWAGGKLMSQTQIIMMINEARIERKLRPFFIERD